MLDGHVLRLDDYFPQQDTKHDWQQPTATKRALTSNLSNHGHNVIPLTSRTNAGSGFTSRHPIHHLHSMYQHWYSLLRHSLPHGQSYQTYSILRRRWKVLISNLSPSTNKQPMHMTLPRANTASSTTL